MRLELCNQTEAAYACGVTDSQWRYYTKIGYVPRPSHRRGRRCYYTLEEVEALKMVLTGKNVDGLVTSSTSL
jgi:DNA-binding transcriptional MerR regulator